jgi:hypothetical protein
MFSTFHLNRSVRLGPTDIGLSFSPLRPLFIAEHCRRRTFTPVVQDC